MVYENVIIIARQEQILKIKNKCEQERVRVSQQESHAKSNDRSQGAILYRTKDTQDVNIIIQYQTSYHVLIVSGSTCSSKAVSSVCRLLLR